MVLTNTDQHRSRGIKIVKLWKEEEISFLTYLTQTMNKRQETPASGQSSDSLPNPKHLLLLLLLTATKTNLNTFLVEVGGE